MPYTVTERSTMHGLNAPHGLRTPHRYPTTPGDSFTDIFEDLTHQLYPTGRVWYMKRLGVFDRFHKAINRSFIRVVEDCGFTLDSFFPDNTNFTEEDATLWEYRLGLVTNTSLPLSVRMDAIRRKFTYPGNVIARQHPLFIQSQLQAAGFDVYVHENKFFEGGEWVHKTPSEVGGLSVANTQHGGITQHGGGTQHGALNYEAVANSADPIENYAVGGEDNLWATFFIGGEMLGDMTNVPSSRLYEFKELILKLKPAHTVAYLFINFV